MDQPPAHHAMHRRDRATFDHAGDGLPLSVVELGRLSCRLAIQETVRTAGVEAQHPVPDDLKSDTADLGRLGARRTVIDRRKRQKPSGLRAIFASPGQTPQLRPINILAKWYRSRHDEPPRFAVLNLTRPHWGSAQESWIWGPGRSRLSEQSITRFHGGHAVLMLPACPRRRTLSAPAECARFAAIGSLRCDWCRSRFSALAGR